MKRLISKLRTLCVPFARWLLSVCHEPYALIYMGRDHVVGLQSNIDRNILAEVLEQVSDKLAYDPDVNTKD